jgi:hypothetical protein
MAINTDALTLLTLGIRGDQPLDPEQPALLDGIHCRWASRQDLGVPWYGYYLFRRESQPSRPRCLRETLGGIRSGSSRGLRLETPMGRLSGTQTLVFTEEFPPAGVAEVDLGSGAPLRFDLPPGVEARRIDIQLGFRSPVSEVVRTCVDFRRFPLGLGPSPRSEQGVVFTTQVPPVSPQIAVTSIEQWPGSPPGLQSTPRLVITLPHPATRVDLLLTNRGDLKIASFTTGGAGEGVRAVPRLTANATAVSLTGKAITRITVDGSGVDPALLHEICFEFPAATQAAASPAATTPSQVPAIEVRGLAGAVVAAHAAVAGNAGQVVAATLEGAAITAVEVGAGNAVLVDLCVWASRPGATFGWEAVQGFQYPLCLPVAHPDYRCPGKPDTIGDAKALALSRVTYGDPASWAEGFADLHAQLEVLVQGGPGGPPMAQRTNPVLQGVPLSPATQADLPAMPGTRPLDLILLASLHPAIAQMVGLYFVDRSAAPDVAYDYLLLADPGGVLGGSAADALNWLAFHADPTRVEAVLARDRRSAPRPPIALPGKPRTYALPVATTRTFDGGLEAGQGSVGLDWDAPAATPGTEQPDRIVLYYPKRAALGVIPPASPAAPAVDAQYQPLPDISPVLLARPLKPQAPPGRSPDWPPPPIALHAIDPNLPEGWYSYRLSGQTLFGLRSALGPPGEWFQWDPPAGGAPPWYYKPSGHVAVHPFAVAVLDKVAPPPPTGVEAWALDPLDRWVFQDTTYDAWRHDHPAEVGLRVRWRWTLMQQLQAPDIREFRLYYQPGRLNALLGRIVAVTAAGADQSDVDTDIAGGHPAGAFAGARLRVGNEDFAIVGSQAGPGLRLRVKNLGVSDEVQPAAGKFCTVALPGNHPLYADFGQPTAWAARLWVEDYAHLARMVVDPAKDPEGKPLTDATFGGQMASVAPGGLSTAIAQLPAAVDLSGVQPWLDHLWLDQDTVRPSKTYRIVTIDAALQRVTLEGVPSLAAGASRWTLGRPVREYEVFLPAPDSDPGKPFAPSLAEPSVYAQVAVSAADVRTHTADDPKWDSLAVGKRFGNEGRVGPAATIFRVLQTPPDALELPELPARLLATPADYDGRSFFTFHWQPAAQQVQVLRVHVLRALADTLFQRDWLIRQTRQALDPVLDPQSPTAKTKHLDCFPDGWDPARRKAAAAAVNAIAAQAAYGALSGDAWQVLALLPGNEGIDAGPGPEAAAQARQRAALASRDWSVRRTRAGLAAADDDWFPKSWNTATRTLAAKALNAIAKPEDYPILGDNSLRILAGLPGNEAAFTQLTIQPLDMTDAATGDRRGPDDAATYTPDATRRAWQDTLPGRSPSFYFYRAAFVDGAHNQSALSLATPPVYLPRVVPPRPPLITGVVGGDRKVTLQWAPNREPDLAEYRAYRAATAEAARDLRLMTLAATIAAPQPRPGEMAWDDAPVSAGVTRYYALTAVDLAANESAPSSIVAARAFDDHRPSPPAWNPPVSGAVLHLSWTLTSANQRCRVQRRLPGSVSWDDLSGWLAPGVEAYDDKTRAAGKSYAYRLAVLDAAGRTNAVFDERTF